MAHLKTCPRCKGKLDQGGLASIVEFGKELVSPQKLIPKTARIFWGPIRMIGSAIIDGEGPFSGVALQCSGCSAHFVGCTECYNVFQVDSSYFKQTKKCRNCDKILTVLDYGWYKQEEDKPWKFY